MALQKVSAHELKARAFKKGMNYHHGIEAGKNMEKAESSPGRSAVFHAAAQAHMDMIKPVDTPYVTGKSAENISPRTPRISAYN